jgi:hypothetical protein
LVSPIDLKPRALLVPNGDDEISTCEKIIEKLKAYLPTGWESMLEDSKALSEIAGGDPGLITASKDLLATSRFQISRPSSAEKLPTNLI